MAVVADTLSLLLGFAISLSLGVISLWIARWFNLALSRQPHESAWQMVSQSRTLLDMALRPALEELDFGSGFLLFGVIAASAAATFLWRPLYFPSSFGWADIYVALVLLVTPTLVILFWSDWRARGKGFGRVRDGLLCVYAGLLLLALFVPAMAGHSLWLGQLLPPSGRSLPYALSPSGGLAFLVGVLATVVYLALLDGLFDESLVRVSGALQALLLQLLRAGCWLAALSALAVLFWTPGGGLLPHLLVAFAAYGAVLVLVVAIRASLAQRAARRLADIGWLPLGLAVALALALAIGGT